MIRWAGFEERVYTTGESDDIFNKKGTVGFSSTG
jgi:hypothetical protein